MPTPKQVIDGLIARPENDCQWWHHAAIEAVMRGHYTVIPGRNDTDAYVARYYLTPPVADFDGWSSAASIVLHEFLRGDDDGALHDHPQDFDSTILNGGYDEVTAPGLDAFTPMAYDNEELWAGYPELGPDPARCRVVSRRVGARIFKKAADLHCVTNVLPQTWTMVRTDRKIRSWGFHPFGKPWLPWREFVQHTNLVGKAQS